MNNAYIKNAAESHFCEVISDKGKGELGGGYVFVTGYAADRIGRKSKQDVCVRHNTRSFWLFRKTATKTVGCHPSCAEVVGGVCTPAGPISGGKIL